MPYGEIRVDTITFTNAGVDKSITVSGLFASTSGNLTVTGTISGTTFTGTTASFASGNVTTFSGGTCTITSGVFASGTATNPSISFIADSNTGLYSPGADQVAISTNGTGRLFVDASGNVGVGTGSPVTALQVVGTGTFGNGVGGRLQVTTDSNLGYIDSLNNTSTQWQPLIERGTEIQFHTNTAGVTPAQKAVIDSSGRLGLGSSSPDALLTVNGVGAFGAGAVTTPSIAATGDLNTGFWFPAADTIAASTGGSERLRIDSSGRVGIGTTNATAYGMRLAVIENIGLIPATQDTIGTSAVAIKTQLGAAGGEELIRSEITSFANSSNYGTATIFSTRGGASVSERLRITSAGNVGIGTTSPAYALDVASSAVQIGNSTDAFIQYKSTAGNWHVGANSSNAYVFYSGTYGTGTERARIDSSGRLLVGTSTSQDKYFNTTGNGHLVQIESTSVTLQSSTVHGGTNADAGAHFTFARSRGTAVGSVTAVASGDNIARLSFQGADGTEFVEAATITCNVDGTPGANDMPGRIVLSTTSDGASSPTERMRITSSGDVRVGSASAYNTEKFTVNNGGGITSEITAFGGSGGVNHRFYFHNGTAGNAAGTVYWTNANSTTGRSINAGGTINASGADYAEYMTKAGNFTIAKGEICGVDANAKLTKAFANAVSFLVKSTDPSYVGNDSWGVGYEDEPDGLETERQKVDRIAFAGQVPVNVIGATPGQYIVPIATKEGGIIGIAKDEADLTLAEYMRAVGKVIAIDDDGRARIIVKVV